MRILQAIICQQYGQPRRTGKISRNIKPSKADSGRNRQTELTSYK